MQKKPGNPESGRPSPAGGESERKYRHLYDTIPDMMFLRDPEDGRLIDVNPAACRVLGYPREELLWRNFFTLLASEAEIADARRTFAEALRSGSGTRVALFRRKDGSTVEAEMRNAPIEIAGKTWMLGVGRDLTAQRKLERQALVFYQAFRNSNDYMFYTDRNGIILDVNDAFMRRFGYAREEAVGRSPRIVRSELTTNETYRRLWADIADPGKGFWSGRIVNRTKSGELVPLILSITAVKDPAGGILGFVSSAVDLSEQEKLQRQLSKTESLAAVGSMAAMLAHEIRNPLGSIVTAAKSISQDQLPAEDRDTLLAIIRKESRRLSDSLGQFLQYARPREPRKSLGDLNAAIREILRIVRSDSGLRGRVRIEERLAKSLRPLHFDGDLIRQVLWNVILNALEAMSGTGRLRVETSESDGEVAVRVEDNGPGIAAEELKRIFEPFHSTKQKGSGLGLAVAERIAAAHGGGLVVESEPGRGARFSLILPRAEADP